MSLLSVIVPVYNEVEMIPVTAGRVGQVLGQAGIDYELVFINDGSADGSWPAICLAAEKDSRVRGICFSRNFGKEAAMMAGLRAASGDCAVIMDCDLQHPPETIPDMYRLWEDGFEVIEGVKESRGRENPLHRFCAKSFYRIISSLTGIDMSDASDFKLMDRKVIDILAAMPERNTFFRALSSWVGFRSTHVKFRVQERQAGASKWSPFALIGYAVSNIVSFSAAPMQAVTVMGIIFLILSLILGIQSLVWKLMDRALPGFTTVILIELIIGSIVMISLGIIGYYISKMFEELKGRPQYIISAQTAQTGQTPEDGKSSPGMDEKN